MVIEVAVVALVDADLGEAVVMAEEVAAVMVVEALVAEAEEALVDTVAVDHREFYLHITHLMLNLKSFQQSLWSTSPNSLSDARLKFVHSLFLAGIKQIFEHY